MELLVALFLTMVGLGVLWAAASIFVVVAGFLVWMFAVTLAAITTFFTGRWLWELLTKDYPKEDKADKT